MNLIPKESQLKRFHELVDKRLDSVISPGEQAELQAIETAFDKTDLFIMAQKQHQWDEPKAKRASEPQMEQQLNEIGKKLDELLHQFVNRAQNQEEP
ncbi:hypothetical protein FJZ31_31290 [Candidatus Poribacteria bacterium]|nr:hypothetical protein [Candidatus Poribacteria bacterium]